MDVCVYWDFLIWMWTFEFLFLLIFLKAAAAAVVVVGLAGPCCFLCCFLCCRSVSRPRDSSTAEKAKQRTLAQCLYWRHIPVSTNVWCVHLRLFIKEHILYIDGADLSPVSRRTAGTPFAAAGDRQTRRLSHWRPRRCRWASGLSRHLVSAVCEHRRRCSGLRGEDSFVKGTSEEEVGSETSRLVFNTCGCQTQPNAYQSELWRPNGWRCSRESSESSSREEQLATISYTCCAAVYLTDFKSNLCSEVGFYPANEAVGQ